MSRSPGTAPLRRRPARLSACAAALAATACGLVQVHGAGSLRSGAMSGMSHNSSSSAAATSQSSTTATDQTSQSVSTGSLTQQAQASLAKSIQALQAVQATQAAARAAAISGANNLGLDPSHPGQTLPNVVDGLGGGAGLSGGLVPTGGLTVAPGGSTIQVVQLGTNGNGTLNLSSGGVVTLPKGTTGNDIVSISGAGSITSTGGTVTATSGSIATTGGGTIATTNGGSIAVTGGSSTVSAVTPTNITSTVAGTVTLSNGQTMALAAGTPATLPAGSKLTFTGSSTGTLNISGSGTLTLGGSGVLSLAGAPASGSGGTITTNTGILSFTSGVTTSLPAGSKISLTGAGSISVSSGTSGAVPVILPATAGNYTTSGSLLTSTGFTVPSGWTLGPNGALTQSVDSASGHITDTITQEQQQALLTWNQFDIGKNTTLSFDQSAGGASVGQWVAINEITDPSLRPSQILGSIEAPGQVYVINQNGIIFGGSSQVNVHTLVASSLPINSNLVAQGLLSGAVTDDQFLFSQLTIPALNGPSNPTAAFVPPAAPPGGDGDVTVQPGAELSSPTNPEHVGGRIALIGPVVNNGGTITVPDGQAILAAGLQVGLEAHSQSDPTLRGLDVFVGEVTDPTYNNGAITDAAGTNLGTATNSGDIEAPRADVTIAGKQVNQDGVINSSTSVSLNGRIDLLADYNSVVTDFNSVLGVTPTATGQVTFGADTVAQILPELTSSDTIVGTSLALPSVVNVQGSSIYMDDNSLLLAPGASINSTTPALDLVGSKLSSGVTFNAGTWAQAGSLYNFLNTTGQVYLNTGASIDVSGSVGVAASVAEDIVPVQLRGPELADSPLQQNGALRRTTVYIDIRDYGVYDGQAYIGTPLADASGYVGLIQHSVGELTVNGGTVALNAGYSVALQSGSLINVSGGFINYQGATVQTTQVLENGQLVDISKAIPNVLYQGVYTGYSSTSLKWGVTQKFSNQLVNGSHYDDGYTQGGNAGSLTITSPQMALDGQLLGLTVAGSNQRSLPSQIESTFTGATFSGSNFESVLLPIFALPSSGNLVLSFTQNQPAGQAIAPTTASPNVTFQLQSEIEQNPSTPIGPFGLDGSGNPLPLPVDRQNEVVLSQDLVNSDGFDNLTVDTSVSGNITVPAGVNLNAGPGGSIAFRGANIDLESSIVAPGGTLSFSGYDVSPYNATASTPSATRGLVTLGADASLSVAGLTVNDLLAATAGNAPKVTAGGSITINSLNVALQSGSTIDASGGVYVSPSGALSFGQGGSITIRAGADPSTEAGAVNILGGNLLLGASYYAGQSLSAYSGGAGGSLVIQAPLIQIGGTPPNPEPTISPDGSASETANTLVFAAGFFNDGGFSHFTFSGLGAQLAPGGRPSQSYAPGLVVASGTVIDPLVESLTPTFNGNSISLVPMTAAQAAEVPASLQPPVSLTFSTTPLAVGGVPLLQGNVVVDTGALIELQPNAQSSVTIKGDTVAFGGQVIVPGGLINVSGASNSAQVTVDLEPGSLLSAQGQTQLSANTFGYKTGTVLNGGTVNVSGNIVGEAGAVIDVSGWQDTLQVLPGSAGTTSSGLSEVNLVPTVEDSNGGSITLAGGELLWNDATLLGTAGGSTGQTTAAGLAFGHSTAGGGTLKVSSGSVNGELPSDVNLTVVQSDSSLPALSTPIIGSALVDAGYLTADRLDQGGFGAISLGGVVQFSGAVDLTASRSLSVASGGFLAGTDGAQVTLSAPYVALGGSFATPTEVQLQKQAGLIYTFGSEAYYLAPVAGDGVITVNASTLTDVGDLDLLGISTLNFNGTEGASGFTAGTTAGDIRGDGFLDIAGTVNLNAREIYPPTEASFTIDAYDNGSDPGTVNITRPAGSKLPSVPLSAGGTLNIYASVINQGGALRAPIGTINLGWNGTGPAPINPVTNASPSATESLTLAPSSVTSVSADGAVIPYGSLNSAGDWIDPAGNNITAGGAIGLPAKLINFSALDIATESGAVIDISGGGDLYANVFVPGLGGTNNIAASTASFAILRGYSSDYAYAPFDAVSGYATGAYGNLQVGDQVQLEAGGGLPATAYTLLPAGYALIPGGYLVTPKSGAPGDIATQPDGSSLVGGMRSNGLDSGNEQVVDTLFEVASQSVLDSRAQYDSALANTYFPVSAPANNVSVPRLPVDAGQVVFIATQDMTLSNDPGTLLSTPGAGGLGGEVDIASPIAINIYNSQDPATMVSGALNLATSSLDAFGAQSLLIGGYRQTGAAGTSVSVLTDDLTVNNAGATLTGPDVILVSTGTLSVEAGSAVNAGNVANASSAPPDPILLLNGNGTLLRVSSSSSAQVVRSGVVTSSGDPASLTIGAGATIAGASVGKGTTATAGSVALDSTNMTSLDPSVGLSADALVLNSGMISLELPTLAAPLGVTPSGLLLSSTTLETIQQSVQNLSLLSYSTFDIYGSGSIGGAAVAGKFPVQSFSLSAGAIRGFDNGGGDVSINAQSVTLGGLPGGLMLGASEPSAGSLSINAAKIALGDGTLQIDQFAQVNLAASEDVVLENGTGALTVSGALAISTPLITAAPLTALTPVQEQQGATPASPTVQTISAGGALAVTNPGGPTPSLMEGLDGSLTMVGSTVSLASTISLPTGAVTLHATQGDATVASGGSIKASGTTVPINDLVEGTTGGQVTLESDSGNVALVAGSTVDVSASTASDNGGTLNVAAPKGAFNFFGGTLLGSGGSGAQQGNFSLDVATLTNLDALSPVLLQGGFTQAQSICVRTGDVAVNNVATAHAFTLEADDGSITVNGEINSAGSTGGMVDLSAAGSVTLAAGSLVTVEGAKFNDAGQGGSVWLQAGSDINGQASTSGYVNIASGATLNLTVDSSSASSAALGEESGQVHIRAPQLADGSNLQVSPIQGSILGASSVSIEGYRIYVAPGASIDAVEGGAASSTPHDGTVFGDAEGFVDNTSSILASLLGGTPTAAQSALYSIVPGAEIINLNQDSAANPTAGDLVLSSNWNLSSFRFGPDQVAGNLTLRAAGNLIFDFAASLSDGFTPDPSTGLWKGTLMSGPSWSYQLVAGADFSAAGIDHVLPESQLVSRDASNNPVLNGQGSPVYNGSVLVGLGSPALPESGSASSIIEKYYQTIRTGQGSITISAGGDVQLLNNLATIYTAGSAVADPTLGGTFQVPVLKQSATLLGYYTPPYPVQYSDQGGNVTISAQNNIGHYMADGSMDSSAELPANWLDRQGSVGPDGNFATNAGDKLVNSTSWWIDFSNFFEGVGALGGGNVTLSAGNNIDNVDAVVPTNARMPGVDASGNAIAPQAGSLVELGGGDLLVQAGHDINGGVYYVERGEGTLQAGDQILTNSTRAAVVPGSPDDPQSYLPTTLFLGGSDSGTGSATFTINAGGDVLLGPVANPFLLPQGINNTFYDKTYFSTYSPSDAVSVTSLAGSVTLQDSSDFQDGSLLNWFQNVLLSSPKGNAGTLADSEPWLGLVEDSDAITDFQTVTSLMAPTLQVDALGGDINIRGGITLAPSSRGTLNLLATGSINGFQPNGLDMDGLEDWGSSTINVSDADPASLPSFARPLAPLASAVLTSDTSTVPLLDSLNQPFLEVTGATVGVSLQTQETIHDPTLLHANDPTGPVHLYAETGDISGVNLYSPKATDIIAGEDVTDVAFYLQNLSSSDISLLQAGRDIIAYDVNSTLRLEGQTPGNELYGAQNGSPEGQGLGAPNAGDIQIAGPGTLEVLAGRNFNLGVGPTNGDGTAAGLVSIGGSSNPGLQDFTGADIVAASGLGNSQGLAGLDFSDTQGNGFIDQFLNPSSAESNRYLPDLGTLLGLPTNDSDAQIWSTFGQLSTPLQDAAALKVFYLVLRDAGRDHNDSSSPNVGTYTEGFAAVKALFGSTPTAGGDISLTSREIKTTNGGDISLLARDGSIDVGLNNAGAQAVDQGILTVDGGNINIYADGDVNVGTSRIFTLHGGNEIIWSTKGNIDAGASSKTVQSAPPTRVIVDPTSGNVATDLAGLATGGGIGVLETVVGAPPGDVDLIAPAGIVDAGDAGIRASGNLNIAAVQVLNASNISVGGKSSGVPAGASTPNIGALSAASNTVGAALNSGTNTAQQQNNQSQAVSEPPSIITVEVLGYGGGDSD